MKATEILMEEHEVILRVITALEKTANQGIQKRVIHPGFFLDAADFIKGFADGCHHKKEEGVLFVAMNAAGMPIQGSPIGVMLAEHEQGRLFTRAMREAAQRWTDGEATTVDTVIQNALGYANLLRQHIQKENNILFPMADRVIPLDRQAQVEIDFKRIEHEETGAGVHEKYLALAEKLEKETIGLEQ
jgi:hemerythrin-like domain-containing protein